MSPFGRGRAGRGFGRHRFGGSQPGIADDAAFTQETYVFEVWTKNNTRLARLPQWTSAQWTEVANQPNLFEFTYPFDDEHKAKLVYPNRIYLYDRIGTLIDGFTIAVEKPTRTQDGQQFVALTCDGLMAQLGTEMISSYNSVTAGDTTVGAIVDALFDLQVRTNIDSIRRGRIDNAIRNLNRELIIENMSILQALHTLQKTVGGVMNVSATGTFTWKRETGGRTGQQIRINKNMPALDVTRDSRNIFTRVIASGKGPEPSERLAVTRNNASAQSTYGVIPLPVSWPDVDNIDQLTDLADKKLREVSRPKVSLRPQTIDLSLSDDAQLDFTHEALKIGSRVTLIDTELAETHDTRIAKIVRDLFSPVLVKIDVQNPDDFSETTAYAQPQRDIVDVFVDLIDRVNTLTLRDTLGFASGGFPTSYLASDVTTWDTTTNTGTLDDHLNDPDLPASIASFISNIINAMSAGDITNIINKFSEANYTTITTQITNNVTNVQNIAAAIAADPTAAASISEAASLWVEFP